MLISEVSILGITLPSAIHRRRSQFDHSLVTLTIVPGSKYWPRQSCCLISQSVFFLILFQVHCFARWKRRHKGRSFASFIQLVCLISGESLSIFFYIFGGSTNWWDLVDKRKHLWMVSTLDWWFPLKGTTRRCIFSRRPEMICKYQFGLMIGNIYLAG